QKRRVELREVADLADAAFMQGAFRHFTDARNLAHVETGQETRFATRWNPQYAVGLGLVGSNFRNEARRSCADGAVELRRFVNRVVQCVRGGERRAEQPF